MIPTRERSQRCGRKLRDISADVIFTDAPDHCWPRPVEHRHRHPGHLRIVEQPANADGQASIMVHR
jgi:hypothetical protein